MNATANGIGASVKRREDFRFLKGLGRYTDDIAVPGQTVCVQIAPLLVSDSNSFKV